MESLYAFSQQLLVTENVFELLNLIPKHIVDSFGVSGAAMFLEAKQETYYLDNKSRPLFSTEQLKAICGRGEPVLDRERGAVERFRLDGVRGRRRAEAIAPRATTVRSGD